jgi:Methylamine utilisation protein MauE
MLFDPLLVWIAVACTATLFAHAAVAKFADLPLLEQHLHAYGVPMDALPIASKLLPAAEALAALLLLTPWQGAGALLAAALLLMYAAAMGWHRAQGRTPDCGCGGEPLPVSWALVVRNLVLAGIALAAGATMTPRDMGLADFLVVAAALMLGTLLYAALHQLLRHRVPTEFRRT